jgi:GNAT superfamily N-acetyltransferase
MLDPALARGFLIALAAAALLATAFRNPRLRTQASVGALSALLYFGRSPALGRFSVVALAERDGVAVGFVAGRVRALPVWFGGGAAGFISDVYVSDSERGSGIGRRVLAFALDWFARQGLSRVELQVLAGNQDAVRFYRELGWHEELVQMVWDDRR